MKLDEVSRSYDFAARRYDRRLRFWFGHVLRLERYRRQAIAGLGELKGATVLDVGCGTGANFPALAAAVGASGRVIGVDYSEGMLAQAAQRVRGNGWDNVDLRRGDAVRLDVVDGPVDAIVSMYCLGIVHDLHAALGRMVELLRPGGSLAVLDFERTRPDAAPLRWLYPLYARYLVATGVDTSQDLDDDALRARWAAGKELLRSELATLDERHFQFGMGLYLAGRKPP